jgi:hypothetical protein
LDSFWNKAQFLRNDTKFFELAEIALLKTLEKTHKKFSKFTESFEKLLKNSAICMVLAFPTLLNKYHAFIVWSPLFQI